MPVTYTIEGETFGVGDLTLDESEAIEKELGITWGEMNPAISATQAKAVLARFVARTKGLDEARKFVGALTVTEFSELMQITEEPAAPKEKGASSKRLRSA